MCEKDLILKLPLVKMDFEGEGVRTPKVELEEGAKSVMNSKMKGAGNQSSKDMIFRADRIDLKNLDAQLEKHLSRVWSRNTNETKRPREEWEVELAKLDLRYVVAHGAYGTVYRGTYDTQDVAGISLYYLYELYIFFFLN